MRKSVFNGTPVKYENLFLRLFKNVHSFAITISPKKTLFLHEITTLHMKLFYYLSGYEYALVGEFDDTRRWHYHGVVVGAANIIKDMLFKELGCFVDVGNNFKSVQPGTRWFTYMCKGIPVTMTILHSLEYPVYIPVSHKIDCSLFELEDVDAEHPCVDPDEPEPLLSE